MHDGLDLVIRALPCALRGASTDILAFNSFGHLVLPSDISPALATALVPIVEPCVLFRALDSILKHLAPRGLLCQALYSGVRESLRSYLSLISDLEARTLNMDNSSVLSLSYLQILLQTPTLYLRLFLSITKQCLEPPVNVLQVLYDYTQHGDPLIRNCAEELYEHCQKPFKRLLDEWENFGSLGLDVYHEFFVHAYDSTAKVSSHSTQGGKNNDIHRFELDLKYLPPRMAHAEAAQSLDRGRALYFIREICGDTVYDGKNRSFAEIMSHTHALLYKEHKLLLHFRGLRDFLLLANGDFVDALFRNDTTNFLMQPLSKVGGHMAHDFFTSAIDDLLLVRGENDEAARCVDASIMDIGNTDDRRVWEAFIGKYHLDSLPLRFIVDKAAISAYSRSFASLWRIRLAVYSLTESSSRLRWLSRYQKEIYPKHDDTRIANITQLIDAHAVMNAGMLHVQQFLYYRIIDEGSTEFERAISKSELTVTEIKSAHDRFVTGVAEATASPERSRRIQELTKIVLGLQRVLEDAEIASITESDLALLVTTFNKLVKELHYDE